MRVTHRIHAFRSRSAGLPGRARWPCPRCGAWPYEQGGKGAQEPGWSTSFVEETLALDAVEPLQAQLDHFCNVMVGKAEPIITVADALQSLLTAKAVSKSIARGNTVTLQDLT